MATFTDLVTFEVHTCPSCYMQYAAPESYFRRKSEEDEGWQCPEGHYVVFIKSSLQRAQEEAALLRQSKDSLQRSLTSEIQAHRRTEYERRAQKGVVTRIKNRVKNGVCPCCNRSFKNLERHMASQHPDFGAETTHGSKCKANRRTSP